MVDKNTCILSTQLKPDDTIMKYYDMPADYISHNINVLCVGLICLISLSSMWFHISIPDMGTAQKWQFAFNEVLARFFSFCRANFADLPDICSENNRYYMLNQ